MAELNLQRIIDRLNIEFTGDIRKLVFWYDDNADFAEEIQDVVLDNAKVYFPASRQVVLYEVLILFLRYDK